MTSMNEQEVRKLAYEIYCEKQESRALEDWLAAEYLHQQGAPAKASRPTPTCLYKYVGCETHHFGILSNLSIRFTQPDDFNDPFDCIPGVLPPKDIAAFVDATLARNAATIAQHYSPAAAQQARATMIAQYTSDPDALVARCFEAVRRNLNTLGILALADRNDSLPMWAHYADNHRGIVLGLKPSASPLCKRPGEAIGEGELKPVIYQSHRLMVHCDPLVIPPDALFIKGVLWSYESEWRVVRRLAGCDRTVPTTGTPPRVYLCNIDPAGVGRIDVGANASSTTVAAVKAATAPGTPLAHVPCFRAQFDAGRTRMHFSPL
jgi:hypothetical protein